MRETRVRRTISCSGPTRVCRGLMHQHAYCHLSMHSTSAHLMYISIFAGQSRGNCDSWDDGKWENATGSVYFVSNQHRLIIDVSQ